MAKREKARPAFGNLPNASVPRTGDLAPDRMVDQPLEIDIDGTPYKVGRIRLEDISAVYGRIRDNRLKALLRNRPSCPDHVLAQAMAYSAAIDPTEADYWAYSHTPAGLVYIIWRSMVRYQPRLTERHIEALVEKENGLIDLLFAESGMARPQKPDDPDEEGENRDPLADKPVFPSARPSDGSKAQDG